MSTKNAKYTYNSSDSTIRISKTTKTRLEELDFVRKHSFEEIIEKLIEEHEKRGRKK